MLGGHEVIIDVTGRGNPEDHEKIAIAISHLPFTIQEHYELEELLEMILRDVDYSIVKREAHNIVSRNEKWSNTDEH